MPMALELLQEGRNRELWEKYCGFIDLNIEQFMTIQHRLLMEQIELLKNCELGSQVMRKAKPRTVEEFRIQVPITTYADYAPYLPEQRENGLPEKPKLWQRTSGRSSEYSYKWVPITERMYRELGDSFMALLLFASCTERDEVRFEPGDKFLYGLAPPPYASGCWAHRLAEEGVFEFLPPMDKAENLEFQERIEEGFRLGLTEGIDMMAGISVLLLTVGERFGQGGGIKRIIQMLGQPKTLPRLLKAFVSSKMAGHPLRPQDVWKLKGLVCSGTDSSVYRERIKQMWGRYPLDIYGATECVIVAMQTWDYSDMTFVPFFNFLEFLPEAEYTKWSLDHEYRPLSLLLDEVVPGEKYAPVITNFLGGVFVRYLLGDMIRITSLRNTELNINIPQMAYYSRVDNVLDFAGASFTEKAIWQAIEDSGFDYVEWVARKESTERSILHIYIEPKNARPSTKEVTRAIDRQLQAIKEDYAYMVQEEGHKLLQVTLLPDGAFQRYSARRQAAGSDPAWWKPPHINASDEVIAILRGDEAKIVTTTV